MSEPLKAYVQALYHRQNLAAYAVRRNLDNGGACTVATFDFQTYKRDVALHLANKLRDDINSGTFGADDL